MEKVNNKCERNCLRERDRERERERERERGRGRIKKENCDVFFFTPVCSCTKGGQAENLTGRVDTKGRPSTRHYTYLLRT